MPVYGKPETVLEHLLQANITNKIKQNDRNVGVGLFRGKLLNGEENEWVIGDAEEYILQNTFL